MTRREQLRDQYEDALFALLMDDLVWQEGERLLEENERLKNDPEGDVPEEAMLRCRRVIDREFNKRSAARVCRVTWKVVKRLAAAACIAVLLFTAAFAVSDTVRINTLNLMIEVYDRYTDYRFVPEPEQPDTARYTGFEVGWLPEGFALVDERSNQFGTSASYKNFHGETLAIDLYNVGKSGTVSIDTEDAEVENITINGREAAFNTKDYYQIVMPIPEKQQILCASYLSETELPPKEEFIKIVESITLSWETPAAADASDTSDVSGFEVGWLPEGFALTDGGTFKGEIDATYEGPHGETLSIILYNLGENGTVGVDTEDAEVEDITINGREAAFNTKDYYQIVMPIPEKQQVLCVAYWSETELPPKELLIQIVESISFD